MQVSKKNCGKPGKPSKTTGKTGERFMLDTLGNIMLLLSGLLTLGIFIAVAWGMKRKR